MDWLIQNKEWLFSGVGIAIFSFIFSLFLKSKNSLKQKQSSGKKSTNIQAGNNVNIGTKND